MYTVLLFKFRRHLCEGSIKRVVQEGGVGGGGGGKALWHGSRTEKIEDHGYKNFAFPNQENKQVRFSF